MLCFFRKQPQCVGFLDVRTTFDYGRHSSLGPDVVFGQTCGGRIWKGIHPIPNA